MREGSTGKPAEWCVYLGALLIILAGAGLIYGIATVFLGLMPPFPIIPPRIYTGLAISVLMLSAAAVIFRDTSVLWQIGLQAAGVAAIVIGSGLLIFPLFDNPQLLLGWRSAAGIFLILLAAVLGKLMRYLQRRFLKIGVHAQIKQQLQHH